MPFSFQRISRALVLLPLLSAAPLLATHPLQGAQPDPQVIAQFGLYNNAKLQAYITRQGQQMTAISDRPGNYGFTIVDSPIINAFATPDGHVYFTRGIMAYFNNEAQFTGVLGHELGHITARHGQKQQTKSTAIGIASLLGSVFAPKVMESVVGKVLQGGAQLGLLKYSRDAENEADGLGVKYSTKTGYDAAYMADFFQTLERTEKASGGGTTPGFLSTHPNSADRYERVKGLAAQAKQGLGNRTLTINRDTYLRSIEGLVYGEDPRQGFVENSVFYHPDLKMSFPVPSGWKTQNSPEQFQMAEPNGKALLVFMAAGSGSLSDAASALAKQLGLTSPTASQTTLNGFPAAVVEGDQAASDQQSAPNHVLAHLIQDGKAVYALIGLAPAASFSTYAPQFQSVAQGYQRLTDASKLARQPEHVHIKTATAPTTLASALATSGVPSKRYEEMAILNGMQTTDRLSKGMLYKVVGR
ncbi:MAG: M48 family metalloprotease [Janthinobacterium lividum]